MTSAVFLSPGGYCPQAQNFFARTSGLTPFAKRQYDRLIRGLVNAGVWTKLDVFYVFAAPTSTIALLNLISTSFSPATAHGAPTFTTNVGYTGVDASTTVYIATGFIPSSAGGNYTQDSAHFSVWNNSNITSTHPAMSNDDTVTSFTTARIYPKLTTDSKDYFRINESTVTVSGGASTVGDARGMFMAVRTGALAGQEFGYLNGVDQSLSGVASHALLTKEFGILGLDVNSGTITGAANQICAASIGGSLTQAQATTFYNLLHAYLVTIAGIAY